MNTLNAIRDRRSIKEYDPEHRLTEAELRELTSAAALAPTSFNMQNRHFVVVTDPEVKTALKGVAFGQEQVGTASAVFVITGDLEAHTRFDRYLRDAPAEVRAAFEPMVPQFYDGNPQLLRDEACRSVGLAGMALMLAAKSMGYDSCPMIGFDPAGVSSVLGLDEAHPPLMIVVVGKGTKPAWPRLGLLNLDELVSLDRLGNHGLAGPVKTD